jgi:glycosyltransferase involved in cell wall biosynthesis
MARKPRWAFVHPFQLRLWRGIETWLWNLSAALAESGLDVDIITWQGSLPIPDYVQQAGVQVRRVPSFPYYQRLFTVPYYMWLLGSRRYDHILVNFAGHGEGPALWALRKVSPTPFSVVFHFPRSQVPHRYQEFSYWEYPEKADHLIAVSHFVARQVQEWSERSCAVIGHGVDVKRFRMSAQHRRKTRENLDIPTDSNVLITVAALEERKGVQWVVKALPFIQANHPQTHYVVLGDGPYRQELENLVHDSNLQGSVHLLGWVEDVARYLNVADVALLLSYGEASPVALLEYAASTLPIVTSRHPPFDELVQPEWGAMVNETDTAEVAQLVTALLKDDEKRTSMGTTAQEWVRANRSWKRVAEQYRALIG